MRFFPLLSFFSFSSSIFVLVSSFSNFPLSSCKINAPNLYIVSFSRLHSQINDRSRSTLTSCLAFDFRVASGLHDFLEIKSFFATTILWDDDSGEGDSGGLNGPPKIFWNANKIISILFYDVIHDMRYLKSEISFSIRWLFLMEKGCDYFMKKNLNLKIAWDMTFWIFEIENSTFEKIKCICLNHNIIYFQEKMFSFKNCQIHFMTSNWSIKSDYITICLWKDKNTLSIVWKLKSISLSLYWLML